MSRRGKWPIEISDKIKIDFANSKLNLQGPNGEMGFDIPPGVDLEIEKGAIKVMADYNSTVGKMIGGTVRAIINNNAVGVLTGFTKVLELVGVGYRAQLQGQKLTLALGYSHPIYYELPKKIKGEVEGNNKIVLKSCDKQMLGQVAAEIQKMRPPEPYKGKGILFAGEVIRRKAGKTAKSAK